MRLNPTVALTLLLLTSMLGAGVVSAAWGFAVGREALKGVTQPDTRPTSNPANRKEAKREEVAIRKEEDILATVKARIDGSLKEVSANPNPGANVATKAVADETGDKTKFPLVAQNRNVTMEVKAVRRQGDSLILEVSLRNEGAQPVQFLYNLLTATDDRGRVLTTTTEGLPGQLPSRSEKFSGTISIPTALLDDVQKLSLSLTDYPDQQLRLQMANIPVVK